VPAALSRGIGSETQRPLAVVIVCGTLSACALTLVLLPVMYQVVARATACATPPEGASRAPGVGARPVASVAVKSGLTAGVAIR
jgi:hypothetical protein